MVSNLLQSREHPYYPRLTIAPYLLSVCGGYYIIHFLRVPFRGQFENSHKYKKVRVAKSKSILSF